MHQSEGPVNVADLTPDLAVLVQAFVTVLVIMDPLGNVPVFLTLTRASTPAERSRAALQSVSVAAGVILLFALFGQQLLEVLGISLEALQVAGGLLLVLVALELLRPGEEAETAAAAGQNIAFVPLGTPLLAGPGAIAATMLSIRRADGAGEVLSVVVALLGALAVVYLTMRASPVVERVLKRNGIDLVSRVMGLLLAAIAVQLIADAVQTWIRAGV